LISLFVSIQLKYIFPAGGLLKSTPNTFVEIMIREVKLKNPWFLHLYKGHFAGLFLIEVIFPYGEEFSDSSGSLSTEFCFGSQKLDR